MSVYVTKVAVTTAGGDGSAVGEAYSASPLNGEVYALRVDWHASAPATSDIDVVVESDANRPEVVLYDKDDAKDDLWVYPQVQATSTAGAAITGAYQRLLANGRIKVNVAGCNALAPAVTVYVFVKEVR